MMKLKLKEMMETEAIHYSVLLFFFPSINISIVYHLYYGQYLRYMVYHATKPMQMLGIFSYKSILQYTCLLREASQQSREVKVAHVEDPIYQSHKWQLMKSR